jgi:hypothetical protein
MTEQGTDYKTTPQQFSPTAVADALQWTRAERTIARALRFSEQDSPYIAGELTIDRTDGVVTGVRVSLALRGAQ